ncbi:MAG: crossover junction endodeoxyribonuclease RuvC [Candidatus Saccharimonadales bacterium]
MIVRKTKTILGIDPGTGIVGFGVIKTDGFNHQLISAGVIKTEPNTNLDSRLKTIYDELSEIIREFKPDAAAVEKLFFAQNVTTAISVSHARGVMLLAINQAGLDLAEYTPLQIKQSITGYGRATKKQIQQMVESALKLKEPIKQDDCADALAVAIVYASSVKYN